MLAALHVSIVWKYYRRIISVAQHCYNFDSSFPLPALEGLHMLRCWTVFALLLASPLCSPAKCFGTAEPFLPSPARLGLIPPRLISLFSPPMSVSHCRVNICTVDTWCIWTFVAHIVIQDHMLYPEGGSEKRSKINILYWSWNEEDKTIQRIILLDPFFQSHGIVTAS